MSTADDRSVGARFDDLGPGGSSFELIEPVAEFRAASLAEVRSVVAAAEEAAAHGCWVAGYVAYEAGPAFDAALVTGPPLDGEPLAAFVAFRDRVTVPAPVRPAGGDGPAWALDWSAGEHAHGVASIRELIADGTVYQVNLTTRIRADGVAAGDLYARMLWAQRCRYGALLTFGTRSIVCASPELFFSRTGDEIVLRPMKGTRPRGRWPDEDAELARDLRSSPKDRAENVMIVDLIRSDIGRVAETSSVRAGDLFTVEGYPTVWQLTSTVSASVPPGTPLVRIFDAVFPSGSVTGAPKVSAMAAIADLEAGPCDVYCGAIGFIEPGTPPPATFSVAIRTAVVDNETSSARYGTGGGITWSSVAATEWDELVAKAAVLSALPPGGLLETMRCDAEGGIHNRGRHLRRMAASAAMLGIPFDRDEAERVLDAAAQPGRLRLALHPDGTLEAERTPAPPRPAAPVRLVVLPASVNSTDPSLYHKGLDRRRYLAWRAACPGADDVILVNERGEVTETTIANLVVGRDGRWWTPPVSSGLLPGTERGRLVETGVLTERVLRPSDLAGASIATVNSLRGWRAARLCSAG